MAVIQEANKALKPTSLLLLPSSLLPYVRLCESTVPYTGSHKECEAPASRPHEGHYSSGVQVPSLLSPSLPTLSALVDQSSGKISLPADGCQEDRTGATAGGEGAKPRHLQPALQPCPPSSWTFPALLHAALHPAGT